MKKISAFLNAHATTLFLVVLSIASLFRFIWFLENFTSMVLYMDQLELYRDFMSKPSLINLFFRQHGPHRQGIGYIITYAVATLSDWNVFAEVRTNIALHAATVVIIFWLKWRLFRRWHVTDVFIPLTAFSFRYQESFISAPNISHAVLPILFVFLLCVIWTFKGSWKYPLFSFVGWIAMFSGFAIFLWPLVMASLLISLFREWRHGNLRKIIGASIFMGVLSVALFMHRYDYHDAVACTINPIVDWPIYTSFIGSEIANYFLVGYSILPAIAANVGFVFYIVMTVIFVRYATRAVTMHTELQKFTTVQILLFGITLLFIAFSTAGRACFGLVAASAGRYSLYLLPALMGLYFISLTRTVNRVHIISLLMMGFYFLNELHIQSGFITIAQNSHEIRERWKQCYLLHKSTLYCDDETSFMLMPIGFEEATTEIFLYTEKNKLNIFSHSR